MIEHLILNNKELLKRIHQKQICLGGNKKLKIYGTLNCKSGKRMKRESRVFFVSEKEAETKGYRPCGHCLPAAYKKWKTNNGPV